MIKEDYLRVKEAYTSSKDEDRLKAEQDIEAFWASLSPSDIGR